MAVTISYREEQYPAVSGQRCITVYIPDDDAFLPILAGLLAIPARVEAYAGDDADQAEGLAALWLDAYELADWSPCLTSQWLMSSLRIWVEEYNGRVGNDIAWVDIGSHPYGGVYRQNTPAIHDLLDFIGAFKAGEYTVSVLGITANNRGIQTIEIDGNTVATIDWYSATTVVAVLQTFSFSIADDGVYQVTHRVDSKNASSSNYFVTWNYMHFIRTGD